MLEIMIQGRGGQGAQTAGNLLAAAFFAEGREVQSFATYGGARRGTPVSRSFASTTGRCACAATSSRPTRSCASMRACSRGGSRRGAGPHADRRELGRAVDEFARALPGYRVIPVDGLAISRRQRPGPHRQLGAARRLCARASATPSLATLSARSPSARPSCTAENVAACDDGYRGRRRAGAAGRRMSGRPRANAGRAARSPVTAIPIRRSGPPARPRRSRPAPGARRCRAHPGAVALPPACPVNGDIAEWIALARARDFRGAWDVLDAPQSVPRHRRPHLPPSVRDRVQPRRLRRAARDLQAGALRRRPRARRGLDVRRAGGRAQASASRSSAAGRRDSRRRTSCGGSATA